MALIILNVQNLRKEFVLLGENNSICYNLWKMRINMDQVLEFMKGFNVQTIMSLAGIVWLFSSNLKSEMKLLEAKIDQQSARSDRLYEMFIELVKGNKND